MESRWIGKKLGGLGYRLTPQRLMILRSVEEADGHISAEEICAQVRAHYPQMNISTVYRTLELVKELGLVTEIDLGDGRARYQCMGKGRNHHHLICEKCGKIIDIENSILDPLWGDVQQRYNFKVNMKHLAIFGKCENCKEQ